MSSSSSRTIVSSDWKMSSNYSAEQHNRKFKNHYELKEELGKGGFGTVRRCVEKKPEETEYAVKVNNTPDRKDSMIMEAKICLALCQPTGHINIVNLYDHIIEGDIVYNIYELATGGDIMEDIVKREFYSERDASIAIEQILKGVEFIHSKGFLHRDLKPHNLLLQSKRSKIIKVTDFGLCVARRPEPNYAPFQHGEAGTPAYKSPEVYSNGLYDTDCDVWSCGVILYQLIGGYLPFWDDNPTIQTANITQIRFTCPSPEWDGLNDAKDLISKMLTNVNNRWTIVQCLSHRFIRDRVTTTSTTTRSKTMNALAKFIARRELKQAILRTQWQSIAQLAHN